MDDPLEALEREVCSNCGHTRHDHDLGCRSRVNLYGALVTCGCKVFSGTVAISS